MKINTVVNSLNWRDDMSAFITAAAPDKWKLLRVLPVLGDELAVTDNQFRHYCAAHQAHAARISVEDNTAMRQSYLMVNPEGRFYSNRWPEPGYSLSAPISDVGVEAALAEVEFDALAFAGRYR